MNTPVTLPLWVLVVYLVVLVGATYLLGYFRTRARYLGEDKADLTKSFLDLAARNHELANKADEARERLINQLIAMRREGFSTIPEDESWQPHRLSDEEEADIEEARLGEGQPAALSRDYFRAD